MRIDLGPDEEPEIGLIALIDCIFFLLMFFMVATTFKMQQSERETKEQPIELPRAQASVDAATASVDPFVIGVDNQGHMHLGGAPVTLVTLRDELKALATRSPGHPIRIEGDRRAAFQHIVHVMDLCQFEGLRNIAVRTR